jgi:hypothetical protein
MPAAVASEEQLAPTVVSDGLPSVWILWSSSEDIWVQRRGMGGQTVQGWPPEGIRISGRPVWQLEPRAVADGEGGLVVTWTEKSSSARVVVHRVGPDGAARPGWAPDGTVLVNDFVGEVAPRVFAGSFRDAIVAWHDRRNDDGDVFAQRIELDAPVPTLISLRSIQFRDGAVYVEWADPARSVTSATVERSADGTAWLTVGTVQADGGGVLSFEDRSLPVSPRLGYRLAYEGPGGTERLPPSWLTITGVSCALAGFVPNPSSATPTIEFALDESEGELTVVDLAGRVWLREQVERGGSGTQRLGFDPSIRLPAGVYLIRLVSGTTALVRRGLVLD